MDKYKYFFVSGLCLGAAMAIYLAENNGDIIIQVGDKDYSVKSAR